MAANRFSRRSFLKTSAVALPAFQLVNRSAPAQPLSTRPNIVLIFLDDLDFDEINVYDPTQYPCRTGAHQLGFTQWREPWRYYADPRMLTPHIDSLARDGALFSRFYVTTAICTPSRYSLLTGRHAGKSPGFLQNHPPGTLANIRWDTPLRPDEPNLVPQLRKAGYRTGMVGKWHLGDPVGRLQGIPEDADARRPEVARKIREHYERGEEYLRNEIGFDFAERIYLRNKEALGVPKALQHHNLEWIIEGALNFIDQNREQPFFLYTALTVPHSQYDAIYGEFSNADPLATPAGFLDSPPDVQPPRSTIYERLQEKGIDQRNAMATWIDDGIGAILKKLDEHNLTENTLVLFISDHQSRGKYNCYEGARVPCLMRWPATIKPGRRIDSLCANIDILPLLLEVAGAAAPGDWVDGRSFLSILAREGQPLTWRESLLLECVYSRAVVTDRYKYIANRPPQEVVDAMEQERRQYTQNGRLRTIGWDGRANPHDWGEVGIRYVADVDFPNYFDFDQMYDLQVDPFEQVNLACYPQYQQTLATLQSLLSGHLRALPHRFGEFT